MTTSPVLTRDQKDLVIIGIGEWSVGNAVMTSIGLGSCVGLILHDDERKIGGLAHVMLPKSSGKPGEREGKYADTAVMVLLKDLAAKGSKGCSLKAKLAGGASMFQNFSGNLNIGERNVDALRELLKANSIPIIREDIGGTVGRTITYYPKEGGRLIIRQADGATREI
ncbi:MAG: chemotaxis protein CheD [Methanospirillum sp.]|uniref:chemotaxis protein CheD n=1 Tax=Methanospirillum sp. TaxID=45200 RepID=UPI0023754DB0|nr:chemotaxis protein CheD [Methanospirillum sp.]MDD1727445.1 chemotaxis protein CheD [Methanospirillum sp.]